MFVNKETTYLLTYLLRCSRRYPPKITRAAQFDRSFRRRVFPVSRLC